MVTDLIGTRVYLTNFPRINYKIRGVLDSGALLLENLESRTLIIVDFNQVTLH
jgi:hypothetical protein